MSKRPLGRKVVHKADELEQKPSSVSQSQVLSVKEFFATEDRLAAAIDPDQAAKDFSSLCNRFLEQVGEFAGIATKSSESEEDKTRKEHLFENCLLNLTFLRRLNRLSQFRNKKHRDIVYEERQKVDELYLQLQNLLYEVSHIEQEVARCTDGRSIHDDIELISVEKFYKEASSAISKPDVTETDAHQQMLARLSWELESRKTLATQIDLIRRENEEIERDIESKQALLDTLHPKLEALLEASRPVQELLGMNYEKEMEQCRLCRLLPEPLFYAYVQTMAYKEVFDDNLTLTIEGDVEQAKKTEDAEKLDAKQRESDFEDDDSENGDSQGQPTVTKRGVKKDRRPTVCSVVDQHADDILSSHPMRLDFKIHCKDKAVISVQFSFIPYLGVVAVKSRLELTADLPRAIASAGGLISDETMLLNIFDNDTGEVCPNPVGQAKLEHFNIDLSRKVERVGRVYTWAQRLCGLYFTQSPENETLLNVEQSISDRNLGDESELSNDVGKCDLECKATVNNDRLQECNFLQVVLSKIKRRVLARLALQEQIAQLECLNGHQTPKEVDVWFGGKQFAILSSWKSVLCEEFTRQCGKRVQDFTQINESGWFFQAKLDRGPARLTAYVFVHPDYPNRSPVFVLSLVVRQQTYNSGDCGFLRQLEKATNVSCVVDAPNAIRKQILTIQMRFLMNRLDVGLEVNFGSKGDPDFSREHLFARPVRGRDRQLPFRYSPNDNSFFFFNERTFYLQHKYIFTKTGE